LLTNRSSAYDLGKMHLVELEDITHYYGKRRALECVSLQLPAGRIGLLGPNGAGKSTLLRILLGLLAPTRGQGRLLGLDLRHGPALRRKIGYMPESDCLVPGLSGVEYIALAGRLCGMGRRDAARRAHDLLNLLGMEEARYRKVEEYSTGMKQRLKLAQALVHDPPVLFLDEPTSGLDSDGRERMLSLILGLGRDYGKSILLSTHILGDVERVCDQVVVLHEGRVLLHGQTAALCGLRQDAYRLRLEGDVGAMRRVLEKAGAQITSIQRDWLVQVPTGWTTSRFFELAHQTGVTLLGMRREEENLTDLFYRLLRRQAIGPGAGSGDGCEHGLSHYG